MPNDPSRRAFLAGAATIPLSVPVASASAATMQVSHETRVAAAAARTASGNNIIVTNGFVLAGDGGAAIYQRLTQPPIDRSNSGYFEDASGAWFGLVAPFGQDLNVRMFGCRGDGRTADQAAFQSAIDYAFAINSNLYVPAGLYQVDQLVLPARTNPPAIDDRNRRFKLYGQGVGEGYAIFARQGGYSEPGGTKIRGGDGKAVLVPHGDYPMGGGCGIEICDLAWIGNGRAGTPVIDLRIVQNSSFHHNIIYQEGDGDGLQISMAYQCDIAFNRIFSRSWAEENLGPNRTGVGIRLLNPYSPSQVMIRNNTSKGFHDAGLLGDQSLEHREYHFLFLYNEASTCYNGWTFNGCDGAIVSGNYVEGPEGGFGFKDRSRNASYQNNFLFRGATIGIDLSDPDSRGARVSSNVIRLDDVPGAVGIKIRNVDRSGFGLTVRDNFILKSPGAEGIVGILVEGQALSIDVTGNSFDPRTEWTGRNSAKIRSNLSDEGAYGFVQRDVAGFQMP